MSDQISSGPERTRTVTPLKYPLPHPGLSFDKHLELVKAYSVLSKEGKESVTYRDVGKTISPFKVSGNNKFLESIGILTRIEGAAGRYKPTEEALNIHRDLVWKKESAAKSRMGALIAKTWFWEVTRDLLLIRGKITEDDLIQQLGREAGADPRIHTSSLRILVSYMKFAELLNERDGQLEFNNDDLSTFPQMSGKPSNGELTVPPTLRSQDERIVSASRIPVMVGVLVHADQSEEQIRRAVRIVMEEIGRAEAKDEPTPSA